MGRKAAKVAQTKNKNDAIRTKLYGKFGKEIARAAKEGGTGTDNVRLQAILKDAKRMSVPADFRERYGTMESRKPCIDYHFYFV